MARFDVYKFGTPFASSLAVDVQADILAELETRVIVPLLPKRFAEAEADGRLKPVIAVEGKPYVLMTTDISVTKADRLKELVGNVEADRLKIVAALDFLFQGF